MSDVDDELLALVGNGSSSSRSSSPAPTQQRRRGGSGRRGRQDDESDDDVDASENDVEDDEGQMRDEPVNPFRLEGIYKDEEDRERLLDMPELEREAELAARRDLITQRRQKADLRAMVRSQQMAGKRKSRSSKSGGAKKPRKLKKASTVRRRKADSDDEEDEDDDDDEDEEEEEEESDYESTRRGGRARKPVGKTSTKAAQLQKLKKSRAKAQRRKQGGDDDDESSAQETSESEYDAEEAEELWRRKKERERRERGDGKRGQAGQGEGRANREEERLAKRQPWNMPSLEDINKARIKRDHLARLIHRPDWRNQLVGKFARINFTERDRATGRPQHSYRLVQINDCYTVEDYYEVADQYTNAVCTMQYGEERIGKVLLQFISNSEVTQEEYDAWRDRLNKMGNRIHRTVPSHEATLDQADDLEAYIARPFTEQDINQMLKDKKAAREAYQEAERQKGRVAKTNGNGHGVTEAGYNELLMLQMNEKARKADRERISEAERRLAHQAKLAAHRLSSKTNTPAQTPPRGTTPAQQPSNGNATPTAMHKSPVIRSVDGSGPGKTPLSIAVAATDVDVDLGDF